MCHRKGHLEELSQYRQMMAEEKYFEVQKLIEASLSIQNRPSLEILKLYYRALFQQKKEPPKDLLLALVEEEIKQNNFDESMIFMSSLEKYKDCEQVTKLKLILAQKMGRIHELYEMASNYLIRQIDEKIPIIPEWMNSLIDEYFKKDFNILLKKLAICLMCSDHKESEKLSIRIISLIFENTSYKDKKAKLFQLGKIFNFISNKGPLEIYQNFCLISYKGIQEKKDYKKIIEMVIYFNEVPMQAALISLMDELGLKSDAKEYFQFLSETKKIEQVYFHKYYARLVEGLQRNKQELSQPSEASVVKIVEVSSEKRVKKEKIFFNEDQSFEEEEIPIDYLNHQNLDVIQFCDLAVGHFQSDLPRQALRIVELGLDKAQSDEDILRLMYLKVTGQIITRDYRGAIDSCLIALSRAKSKQDILSFLYCEAEAYLRVGDLKRAKSILLKIHSIEPTFRMTKDRLEKLNEI